MSRELGGVGWGGGEQGDGAVGDCIGFDLLPVQAFGFVVCKSNEVASVGCIQQGAEWLVDGIGVEKRYGCGGVNVDEKGNQGRNGSCTHLVSNPGDADDY